MIHQNFEKMLPNFRFGQPVIPSSISSIPSSPLTADIYHDLMLRFAYWPSSSCFILFSFLSPPPWTAHPLRFTPLLSLCSFPPHTPFDDTSPATSSRDALLLDIFYPLCSFSSLSCVMYTVSALLSYLAVLLYQDEYSTRFQILLWW